MSQSECPCLKKKKTQDAAQQGANVTGGPWPSPCGPGYAFDPRTNQCVPDPRVRR
jgi:hypothetical protein